MSAARTPGRLYYSSAIPHFHRDEVEAYAYYCIIWQATDDPENPALFCYTPNRATMAEAYTDARLIGAAPDLLEALQRLLSAIEVVGAIPGEKGQILRAAAHAAISRALPDSGGEGK